MGVDVCATSFVSHKDIFLSHSLSVFRNFVDNDLLLKNLHNEVIVMCVRSNPFQFQVLSISG